MGGGARSVFPLVLGLCLALPASAETVDFQDGVAPSAAYRGTRDAVIKNGVPTLNVGNSPRLRVTTQDIGTNAQTWTLVRWDLSAHVPPGAVVTGVTVTLDVEATETGAATSIYQLRRAWTEGDGTTGSGATWATTDGTTAWGTAGAENLTTDRFNVVLGTVPGAPAGPKAVALSATGVAMVQGWVDDPAVNYGIIIRGTSADAVDFGSRETGTATRRPKLTVTFTPPAALAPTTVTFRDGASPTTGYTGGRDAYIRSGGSANTNFGATNPLLCDGNQTSRALFRWDVSSIPAGATVTGAQVVLNVTSAGSAYDLVELKRDWVENQVTWNLFATGNAWGTAGADNTTSDRGATVLGTIPGTAGSNTATLNAAGVALVQAWVTTPASAYGLLLRGGNTATTQLSSCEAATAAQRPGLVVTYQVGVVKTISGGSSWTNAAAWTPAGLPGVNDVVQVNGPGVVTFAGAGTTTVRRIVTSGAGLSVTSGTLVATERVWLSGGDLTVAAGATFTSLGPTAVLHTARLDLQGGSLRLGAPACWVGGTLRAVGARIEPDTAGTGTDVEVRGALDLDDTTVRGGALEGLRVFATATVTRLRRARFEALAAGAGARFLTLEAAGPLAVSAPGCWFDAVGAGQSNVRLVDTSGAGEDVVLNLEDRGTTTSGPGVGAALEAEVGGASINWVWAAPDSTTGAAIGFPQVAYDLTTFAEYAMYAAFRDVDAGGTDRIHVFDPGGDGVDQGTWFDVPAAQGDIVGYPWWDQVGGRNVLWVVTTTGRLLRFGDPGPGAGAVAADAGFPVVVAGGAFTTPPITSDSLTVWAAGTVGGAPRLFAFDAATGAPAWTISTGLPDPITSELGTETLQGKTRLFAGGGSTLAGGGVVLLQQAFGANAGTFAYVDDTFRGTNNPTHAAGAWGAGFGRTGGGVRVTLGSTSVDMSGGYRATFTVPGTSAAPVRVDVAYRLFFSERFEFDEFGDLLVAVDGVLVGASSSIDYVARFFGDGNGLPNMDTGWQTLSFVRVLAPGSHTLTLGGYLNKSTEGPEVSQCSFDDVLVQTSPTEGRIYRVDATAQVVDLEDPTPFAPVVAAPFPAYGTGLFVGDTAGRMHGLDPAVMTPLAGWPVQGGTASVQGSVWLDFAAGQVFWGDEAGAAHGRAVSGAALPSFPLASPLGDGAAVRNVTAASGVLWVAGQRGRLRAFTVATGAAAGALYRFGAQHPLGPIGSDWTGRPALQAGGKLVVVTP